MTEADGLVGALTLASPFPRREWAAALAALGDMADDLLPTVHALCGVGWTPYDAAAHLVAALDATAAPVGD